MDEGTDGIVVTLQSDQMASLTQGQAVRIDIPADEGDGTEAVTVILRPSRSVRGLGNAEYAQRIVDRLWRDLWQRKPNRQATAIHARILIEKELDAISAEVWGSGSQAGVVQLSEAAWATAVQREFDRLGLTREQLAEMARRGEFSSVDARKLWVSIGGQAGGS